MKRLLSSLLMCLDVLGINALFRFVNRNKAIILWYHGIRDGECHPPESYGRLHVSESIFRLQLSYLKRRGYSFVNMSELARMLKTKTRIRRLAVVTFDDGYESVIRKAYPIMKELDAKGCLYMVSGLTGVDETLWTAQVALVVSNTQDKELTFTFKEQRQSLKLGAKGSYRKATKNIVMRLRTLASEERMEYLRQLWNHAALGIPPLLRIASPQQILILDRRVLEVGSHTKHHPECTRLSSQRELDNELTSSRTDIGQIVGYEVRHFSYPFGSYDNLVLAQVKNSGYETAVTVAPGFVDKRADLYRLNRIGAAEDMLLFKSLTSGAILGPLRLFTAVRERISQRNKKWQR